MAWTYLLAFQASAAAAPAPTVPSDFDLARLPSQEMSLSGRRSCTRGAGEEIVVCGRRESGGDYPLAEEARRFATPPLRAEASIGGGASARVYTESVGIGPGVVSNRVMFGVRLPF